MPKIYLVRHGQTDYNARHLLQGRLDVPLNETGLAQARESAEKLKDIPFQKIYYSPLKRARQTAEEIYNFHTESEFVEAPELSERYFGKYEGMPGGDNPEMPYFGLWNAKTEAAVLADAESMDEMRARIFPFLDMVCAASGDICLVCHGGVALIARDYFLGTPESGNLLDFPRAKNAEILFFEKGRGAEKSL